jgi:hypothetical protein
MTDNNKEDLARTIVLAARRRPRFADNNNEKNTDDDNNNGENNNTTEIENPQYVRGSGAPKDASVMIHASTGGCCHRRHLRARRRATDGVLAQNISYKPIRLRGALAFRRSATAFTTGCDPDGSAPEPRFLGRGPNRSFACPAPVPVQ